MNLDNLLRTTLEQLEGHDLEPLVQQLLNDRGWETFPGGKGTDDGRDVFGHDNEGKRFVAHCTSEKSLMTKFKRDVVNCCQRLIDDNLPPCERVLLATSRPIKPNLLDEWKGKLEKELLKTDSRYTATPIVEILSVDALLKEIVYENPQGRAYNLLRRMAAEIQAELSRTALEDLDLHLPALPGFEEHEICLKQLERLIEDLKVHLEPGLVDASRIAILENLHQAIAYDALAAARIREALQGVDDMLFTVVDSMRRALHGGDFNPGAIEDLTEALLGISTNEQYERASGFLYVQVMRQVLYAHPQKIEALHFSDIRLQRILPQMSKGLADIAFRIKCGFIQTRSDVVAHFADIEVEYVRKFPASVTSKVSAILSKPQDWRALSETERSKQIEILAQQCHDPIDAFWLFVAVQRMVALTQGGGADNDVWFDYRTELLNKLPGTIRDRCIPLSMFVLTTELRHLNRTKKYDRLPACFVDFKQLSSRLKGFLQISLQLEFCSMLLQGLVNGSQECESVCKIILPVRGAESMGYLTNKYSRSAASQMDREAKPADKLLVYIRHLTSHWLVPLAKANPVKVLKFKSTLHILARNNINDLLMAISSALNETSTLSYAPTWSARACECFLYVSKRERYEVCRSFVERSFESKTFDLAANAYGISDLLWALYYFHDETARPFCLEMADKLDQALRTCGSVTSFAFVNLYCISLLESKDSAVSDLMGMLESVDEEWGDTILDDSQGAHVDVGHFRENVAKLRSVDDITKDAINENILNPESWNKFATTLVQISHDPACLRSAKSAYAMAHWIALDNGSIANKYLFNWIDLTAQLWQATAEAPSLPALRRIVSLLLQPSSTWFTYREDRSGLFLDLLFKASARSDVYAAEYRKLLRIEWIRDFDRQRPQREKFGNLKAMVSLQAD